jgi:hypothetical protein
MPSRQDMAAAAHKPRRTNFVPSCSGIFIAHNQFPVLVMRVFGVIPLMLLHQCSLSSEMAQRGVDHVLWASISPPEEIPRSLGWLVKPDPTSGKNWDTSTFRDSGKGMRSNSARPLASGSPVRHLQLVLDRYGVAQTNTDPKEAFPQLRLERRITLPHCSWTEHPLVLDRTPIGILFVVR